MLSHFTDTFIVLVFLGDFMVGDVGIVGPRNQGEVLPCARSVRGDAGKRRARRRYSQRKYGRLVEQGMYKPSYYISFRSSY